MLNDVSLVNYKDVDSAYLYSLYVAWLGYRCLCRLANRGQYVK